MIYVTVIGTYIEIGLNLWINMGNAFGNVKI